MTKKTVCLWLLFVLPAIVRADWRRDLKAYFGAVPNFEGAARFLQGLYGESPPADRPQISFLLAYLGGKLGDHASEVYWVEEHFENWGGSPIRFDFLGDDWSIEISDFCLNWDDRYPRVSDFALQPAIFSHDAPPLAVAVTFQSSLAANFRLTRGGETVVEGLLKKGSNRLEIGPFSLFKAGASLVFEVWSPAIRIGKTLQLLAHVSLPEGAEMAEGELAMVGRRILPETTLQVTEHNVRYFDGKHFLRKFCLPGAAAASIWIGNQLLFSSRAGSEFPGPDRAAFDHAASSVLQFAVLGFVAKALFGLVQSFKTRVEKREETVASPEAREQNRQLAESLRQAAKNTRIRLELKVARVK